MKISRRILGIVAGFLFVLGAGFFAILMRNVFLASPTSTDVSGESSAVVQPAEVFHHPLTGEASSEAVPMPRVACVMVENSADAWPLSGVERAFLVIEAPVEGNIPRFVACFAEDADEVTKIGPVRSARPYYVSWISGFSSAIYAHVGGSPEALALLEETQDLYDMNEFWNGSFFWRDSYRTAPHNAYTSTALLFAYADRQKSDASETRYGFVFDDAKSHDNQSCEDVALAWGSGYDVVWTCTADGYVRTRKNEPVLASSGEVTLAKNVLVLETDISVIDDVGRRAITTLGSGRALLCRDGSCEEVLWHKDSDKSPLSLTKMDTSVATLSPGSLWIEVVSSLDEAIVTNNQSE